MDEHIYIDVFDEEVVLADYVRASILAKHPEAVDFIDRISLVLQDPAEVRRSISDERQVLYYRFDPGIFGGKWVVVVVKRIDRNFVSTAYVSHRMKIGEVIWTKK